MQVYIMRYIQPINFSFAAKKNEAEKRQTNTASQRQSTESLEQSKLLLRAGARFVFLFFLLLCVALGTEREKTVSVV